MLYNNVDKPILQFTSRKIFSWNRNLSEGCDFIFVSCVIDDSYGLLPLAYVPKDNNKVIFNQYLFDQHEISKSIRKHRIGIVKRKRFYNSEVVFGYCVYVVAIVFYDICFINVFNLIVSMRKFCTYSTRSCALIYGSWITHF